jgi:hypothetical protein
LAVCDSCVGQNGTWSNERTVTHYKHLAFSVLNQFIRTYKIPKDHIPDFEQHMMKILICSPPSYRTTSAGMYCVIKNKLINFTQAWLKERGRLETGHFSGAVAGTRGSKSFRTNRTTGFDEKSYEHFVDEVDYAERYERGIDADKIISLLSILPGPERVCLSLFYGIGISRPLSIFLISKKLSAGPDWVKRKLARGEHLLKSHLQKGSLTSSGGINARRNNTNGSSGSRSTSI